MKTIGKSSNLSANDDFFDAVEDQLGKDCGKYSNVGIELLNSMNCKKCDGNIKCRCESWRGNTISFSGLYCGKCKKIHGIIGFKVYNIDKTPVSKLFWCFVFIFDLLFD